MGVVRAAPLAYGGRDSYVETGSASGDVIRRIQ